jgi:serine/threonine protein phosphatase PrpC
LSVGDKLLLDGRLVEIEETGTGSTILTFDGVENECALCIRSDESNKLGVMLIDDSLEAFYRISSPVAIRLNDLIRIGLIRFEVHRFNHASASVQGIRPSMEDEDFCRDGLLAAPYQSFSMFNVYDGHGGFDASRFLKNRFHRIFVDKFTSPDEQDVVHSLQATFQQSDEELLELVKQKSLSMGVGSVVNSVLMDDKGTFFCSNLGDCRALLGMDDGGLVELSRDLKPLVPEETERIKRCGGFVSNANRVNGRLAVSRAIGDFEYKANLVSSGKNCETMVSSVPEIRVHVANGKEAFLIIACDGLYDVMSSQDVVTFINDRIASFVLRKQEPDPSQICVDLITECVIKRGTSDNVTIILVLLHPFLKESID